ncbi:MAG TPA: Crp/Fnr family transcriptional regulator [Patescibacteria group bacterium]|nr:Crp/Fnr family transcriptional regulator [Patescibacteria group bacterium]
MDFYFDKDLDKLFSAGVEVKYKKGEIILRAEDEPQGIYYLKKGYVKLYNLSIEGREQIISIFKPRSYFPIAWILAEVKNTSYYEALTGVKVLKVPSSKVIKFLEDNPKSTMLLAKRLSSGLNGLAKLINIIFLASAKQRVAYVLVQFAARFGEHVNGKKIKIILPVTHQLISNYAGLVRETVSLEMERLRKQKVIDYSRSSVTVMDLSKLQGLSQAGSEADGVEV